MRACPAALPPLTCAHHGFTDGVDWLSQAASHKEVQGCVHVGRRQHTRQGSERSRHAAAGVCQLLRCCCACCALCIVQQDGRAAGVLLLLLCVFAIELND
jgi:hypothetical protein